MVTVQGTFLVGGGTPAGPGDAMLVSPVARVTVDEGVIAPAPRKIDIASDGAWSVDLPILPEGWAWRFVEIAPPSHTVRTVTLTGEGTLDYGNPLEVVDVEPGDAPHYAVPPELEQLRQDVLQARDDTLAALEGAEQARDEAAASQSAAAAHAADVLAVPATNDGIMTAVFRDENSQFSKDVKDTIGDLVQPVADEVVGNAITDAGVPALATAAVGGAVSDADIPGLVGTEVSEQVDPKVLAAETARTGAETARTGAEAARDLALAGQFAGTQLGNVDLNTITTPGVYHIMTTTPDPHDLNNGGHEPVDADPFIPTGICAICQPPEAEQ